MIGLGLEDVPAGAGFGVAGPFATAAQAGDHAGRHGRPDVALVDDGLRDGLCGPLLRAPRLRGVPVLVCSGRRDHRTERAADRRAPPWLEEPVGDADVIAALTRPLDASRRAADAPHLA